MAWIEREHLTHEVVQPLWQFRMQGSERRSALLQSHPRDCRDARRNPRWSAREHLEHGTAETEYVGRRSDISFSGHLLGRHVCRRPKYPGPGVERVRHQARDSEVSDDRVLLCEKHVLRLDV